MSEYLRIGQRVEMPDAVWEKWHDKLLRPARTGVVTGFHQSPDFVHVQLDGSDYSTTWHRTCWALSAQ
jgi:hypothetical protein